MTIRAAACASCRTAGSVCGTHVGVSIPATRLRTTDAWQVDMPRMQLLFRTSDMHGFIQADDRRRRAVLRSDASRPVEEIPLWCYSLRGYLKVPISGVRRLFCVQRARPRTRLSVL